MIISEFQSIKIFLLKVYKPNWSEEVFVVNKIQTLFLGFIELII